MVGCPQSEAHARPWRDVVNVINLATVIPSMASPHARFPSAFIKLRARIADKSEVELIAHAYERMRERKSNGSAGD